jgi:hypothetical protein
MEAEFSTWLVSVNAEKILHQSNWNRLQVEGVFSYQRKFGPEEISFYPKRHRGQPILSDELIVINRMDWKHLYLHFLVSLRLLFLEPTVDVGCLISHYHYDGYYCINGDCNLRGNTTAQGSFVSQTTFGAGLSLNLKYLRLFGGIKTRSEGTLILVNIQFHFR